MKLARVMQVMFMDLVMVAPYNAPVLQIFTVTVLFQEHVQLAQKILLLRIKILL